MKLNSCLLFFICSAMFALQGRSETIEELGRKVEELERQQAEILSNMSEKKPQMNTFLNDSLTFGGFFEPGYTIIAGKDTAAQAATANILAFNLAADYKSNFRFAAQTLSALGVGLQNPHNDPRAASATVSGERKYTTAVFATTLVQGYVEYQKRREFNIQMGLGYVPFNYSFQERELILFHRRGGPQMLRSSGQIISALWEGVHIHGSFSTAKNSWGYNVYTFSSPEKLNTLGGGGRIWWASPNENVVAGLSTQTTKGLNENHETVGADLKVESFPWIVRSEFFQTFSKDEDPWSVYVEPGVYMFDEEFLFFVFGDFLNNPVNKTNPTLLDKYKRWEYGGGLNWLPTSYTRFRLGVTYLDYVGNQSIIEGQQRDFWSFDLSAGVAF